MQPFLTLPKAVRILVFLILSVFAIRLATMAVLPLMDTTEARYAEIARKMAEMGDWVTPWADDGVPFWGKPPLAFWITAASFRLFGVSEFTARLPHFICSLLICLMVWDLAYRQEGRRAAILAAGVLAGSALFIVSSGAVMTDITLVLGSTAALYGFWLALRGITDLQRRAGGWIFFIGIAIGLLAKGPLVLVLAGLPLVIWVSVERRWKETLFGLPWIAGLVLVAALVLPWYWRAEEKTPGFIDYFIVGEHWKRFLVPGWRGDLYGHAHNFPIGTVWLFALIALLPWPFTVMIVKWEARGKKIERRDRSWVRYTLLWALMPLLFFTASRNIIWTYALPPLPAAALFLGGWLANHSQRAESWVASGLVIMLAIIGGAGAGAVFFPHWLDGMTAKTVAVAYLGRRKADEPLIFMEGRPFSASFYSANAARKVLNTDELETALTGKSGFLAYPSDAPAPKLPEGLVIEEPADRFGRFNLIHVRRPGAD